MSRHSKNNTANPVFTYAERQMVRDFGIQKQRIGVDSQKPFEHCNLCLSKVIEPMVCNHGHIFCKECIVRNMIQQKKNNNAAQDVYRKKKEQNQIRLEEKDEQDKMDHQQKFEKLDYENDIIQRKAVKSQTDQKLQGYLTEEDKQRVIIKEKLQERGKIMITNPKQELTKSNFWIPEGNHFQNNGFLDIGEPPKTQVMCPSTNDHEIKIKKLYRIHLFEGQDTATDEVFCYACSKTLKFQKLCASKRCGHVMCKSCFEKICIPEKLCYQCSKPFEKHDIIQLEEAKSSFVAHNPVQSEKYTPNMLI